MSSIVSACRERLWFETMMCGSTACLPGLTNSLIPAKWKSVAAVLQNGSPLAVDRRFGAEAHDPIPHDLQCDTPDARGLRARAAVVD
ncbi:hypothetical protein KPL78_15625 [Roseomonas sp. HJA6]|uniref:Uncharacterized protein n=1 Tax=Roseomonas alba TaxID=2846776 RepID=A0ABS7ADB1_9PROT|nr:hypothetical protein [Neoroseomonas alba]MBW6399290.1 hypothetical protein [Neoroseomonas alba]